MQVITKSNLGGAQSVVLNLANQLCDQGHEVIVVAGADDGKMWKLLHPGVKQVECVNLQRAVSPVKDLKALWELRSIFRKYRPDVVHLHSSKAGLLGRLAFPSRKVVYTVHGFDSIRLSFKVFLPLEKLMQRFCAAIVGVSQYDVQTMNECHITRNVSYVYNGIRRSPWDASLTWNVPTEKYKKTMLCIARVSPQKKIDLFLEVAAAMPQYAFVWIGNQMDIENHPDNVYFLGNVPDAGRFCQLADLFILPSNYEGLPMVILEAMSFGLPVVASNVGGVSEIVVDDQTGYAVQNTMEAFTGSIARILEDEQLYSKMKRNAEERFEKDLTAQQMLSGYKKIYNKIAAK